MKYFYNYLDFSMFTLLNTIELADSNFDYDEIIKN